MLSLRAIIPKKLAMVQDHPSAVAAGLRLFAIDMTQTMGKYPPYLPTKSGYRRTGTLGSGWGYEYSATQAIVANSVPYAGHVQGYKGRSPRQIGLMERRGWQSISEEAQIVWKRHLPDIQRRLVKGL